MNSNLEILHSIMIHDVTHSSEDIIINKDIFPHILEGDYVQVIITAIIY